MTLASEHLVPTKMQARIYFYNAYALKSKIYDEEGQSFIMTLWVLQVIGNSADLCQVTQSGHPLVFLVDLEMQS